MTGEQDIFFSDNESGLYEFCEACGRDITLLPGSEQGMCKECYEENELD